MFRLLLFSALFLFSLTILSDATPVLQREKTPTREPQRIASLDDIALSYVKLALAFWQQYDVYVDVYIGPEDWKNRAKEDKKSLTEIRQQASALLAELWKLNLSRQAKIIELRRSYLAAQLQAIIVRARQLEGEKFDFDEEAKALYGVTPPNHDTAYFQRVLDQLDKLLPPGNGSINDRLEQFKQEFIVPQDKLDVVFRRAIEEGRRQTKKHIALPVNERFEVEYVTNIAGSAYNGYKGKSHSVIKLNVALPFYIDEMLGYACHEGYPGHHVYNVVREEQLLKGKGWVEFYICPYTSPDALISEGSADYGIEVAFPNKELMTFERDVLFPLAGLNPAKFERYRAIRELADKLNYAMNEAARKYMRHEWSLDESAKWLSEYGLRPLGRAQRTMKFVAEGAGSYVMTYNYGKDLVKDHIERKVRKGTNSTETWRAFADLLRLPLLPSNLK